MNLYFLRSYAPMNDGRKWKAQNVINQFTAFYNKSNHGKFQIKVPTQREMVAEYDICTCEVQKAYKKLREDGILTSRGTSGTYFTAKPLEERLIVYPFDFADTGQRSYHTLASKMPAAAFERQMLMLEMDVCPISTVEGRQLATMQRKLMRDHPLSSDASMQVIKAAIVRKLLLEELRVKMGHLLPVSQGKGLEVVADALLTTGDLVVMETPRDHHALQTFLRLHCEVQFTGHKKGCGMDMRALRKICAARDVRVVFIRADSSWLDEWVTSDQDRDSLIALAHEFNFQIVEYEVESEFAQFTLPDRLAVRVHHARVIFISVLSKLNRLWENINYVVAEAPFIEVLKTHIAVLPEHHTYEFEHAAALLLESGQMEIYLRKEHKGFKKQLVQIKKKSFDALSLYAYVRRPVCGRYINIFF
ncbi:putative transcriptional regulator [Arcticibacter svalbardensis MN12-7]|uniref:Putative transcriptional regulator n=1 Tax=Arcticibacter svalbardensis MN12-7 TaxID=1150600 RepID=R9GYE1_9SPHI|nr:transcriptional regulator [Arcticibacter svalbardensis]EOR94004.1 putative transcriptional regulator [Arcticibacter svalbardensis MN12-7]